MLNVNVPDLPLTADGVTRIPNIRGPSTQLSWAFGSPAPLQRIDRIPEPRSIAFHVLDADDFVLEPLPNHLYTRDTSAWLYGGVAINSMVVAGASDGGPPACLGSGA